MYYDYPEEIPGCRPGVQIRGGAEWTSEIKMS